MTILYVAIWKVRDEIVVRRRRNKSDSISDDEAEVSGAESVCADMRILHLEKIPPDSEPASFHVIHTPMLTLVKEFSVSLTQSGVCINA